jgi:uncharacterized membrane protein YqgA involved in biofilm formation
MKGTLVNVIAIIAGTGVGLLFGRLIPERVRNIAMTAIGLAVIGVGLQMAIDPRIDPAGLHYTGRLPYHPNSLIVILGLVIGGIIGELLQIEKRLESFGHRLQQVAGRLPWAAPGKDREPDAKGHRLVEGFVTASLLFCVGAMAVLGSIKDGLVPLADVLDLIAAKPAETHLVLTGRDAPPEVVDAADLVTEMRLIKHPFQRDIPAQRGVEF